MRLATVSQTLAYSIDLARDALRAFLDAPPGGAPQRLVASAELERICEAGMDVLWPHCEDPFQVMRLHKGER